MRIGILTAQESWERSRAGTTAGHLAHSLERLAGTNKAAKAALAAHGHETVEVPVDAFLPSRLTGAGIDLVFNTYFGPGHRPDQAFAAALMEFAGLPFTGGGAACHFLGLSKPQSKRLFQAGGIPTAPFVDAAGLALPAVLEAAAAIGFPLIVKTSSEGEGIGMDEGSVVRSPGELERAVIRLRGAFVEPPLIERFLPGREFTVGVLEAEPPVVLPILELALGSAAIYSYDAKVSGSVVEHCPASLEEPVARAIRDLAVRAGRAVGCRDCWRVDFRMDAGGEPLVLEVNTLPGLMPGYSDLPKTAEAAGIGHTALIAAILASGTRRLARG
jgi:D-alanine-D-alanine ligase